MNDGIHSGHSHGGHSDSGHSHVGHSHTTSDTHDGSQVHTDHGHSSYVGYDGYTSHDGSSGDTFNVELGLGNGHVDSDACVAANEASVEAMHTFATTTGNYIDSHIDTSPVTPAPTLGDVVSSGLDAVGASEAAQNVCD